MFNKNKNLNNCLVDDENLIQPLLPEQIMPTTTKELLKGKKN